MVRDRVVCVARQIEDAQSRPTRAQPHGELVSAHVRHHDVGDEYLNLLVEQLADLERFDASARGKHAVALRAQNLLEQLTHAVLVLDEQNRLGARRHGRRRPRLERLGRRFGGGQVDLNVVPSPSSL